MYGREKRVLLRHYLEQGLTKTELAQKLGIHRRTIYHWIETGRLDRDLDDELVRYTPRPAVVKKIDPYCGIIQARLDEFPRLSAKRLFDEIRAAGYAGGYTQLKEHVRSVRPAPPPEPLIRFETAPGYQAQVDFASFTLPWGRRYALLVVLGYSRLLWMHFYARQTMQTLFRGLEAAFGFFRGVPAELLFDQMSAVITDDRRNDGGTLVENAEFLRFAHHHGFKVRACRPYRAKTKGKVERPIRYVRQSFFYGRTFLNDEDLNTQGEQWLQRICNVRRHRTLGEAPHTRFERDERIHLRALADRPYPQIGLPTSVPPMRTQQRVEVQRRPLSVYAEAVR